MVGCQKLSGQNRTETMYWNQEWIAPLRSRDAPDVGGRCGGAVLVNTPTSKYSMMSSPIELNSVLKKLVITLCP
jgi:hypothetical protein